MTFEIQGHRILQVFSPISATICGRTFGKGMV